MDSGKGVMAAFIGALVLITYRDFKTPDSTWPLGPVPPPYRYTWAAVIFGIIAVVSDTISPRIATVVAIGVLIGLMFQVVAYKTPATGGLYSNEPGTQTNPINNGISGSSAIGGGGIQQV